MLSTVRPSSPWARLPKFHKGAFTLFILALLPSAILGDQPVAAQLTLSPAGIAEGKGLWQPLTASFMFPDGDMFGLVGTLVVQWFVGGMLEGFWGTRRYVAFALGCGVAGYVAAAALGPLGVVDASVRLGGATPMDLAAVVAFGVVFGKRPLQVLGVLPLSSRTLAALICVLSLISPLARGEPWPKVVPWAVAMLAALVVTTQPWRRLSSSGKVGGRRRSKKRSHLKVVRPDDQLLN